jgi:hypothetical protein
MNDLIVAVTGLCFIAGMGVAMWGFNWGDDWATRRDTLKQIAVFVPTVGVALLGAWYFLGSTLHWHVRSYGVDVCAPGDVVCAQNVVIPSLWTGAAFMAIAAVISIAGWRGARSARLWIARKIKGRKLGALQHGKAWPDLVALIEQRAGRADPADYAGNDWWQLSPEEAAVFGLRLEEMPVLVETFHCFQAATGRASGTEWDLEHAAALQAACAEWRDLVEGWVSRATFLEFAEACGVKNRAAAKFYRKHEARLEREGVMQYEDGS